MPIDPLFRVVTVFGDADELIVGVSKSLEYLFRHGVPTRTLARARVFDVQLVLHGTILAQRLSTGSTLLSRTGP